MFLTPRYKVFSSFTVVVNEMKNFFIIKEKLGLVISHLDQPLKLNYKQSNFYFVTLFMEWDVIIIELVFIEIWGSLIWFSIY